jgi:hypothetical protein
LGVGWSPGRCVLGVGCAAGSPRGRWVLGVGRWVLHRAATTRSPDGILCRASLDVVLKHPSSWRRDPWGFIFGRWVFGRWVFGRWVFGRWVRGRVTPGGGVDDEVTLSGLRWPIWKLRSRVSRRYSRRRCKCPVGLVIAERWVFGRWVLGVGCAAGSPPGGQVGDEATLPGFQWLA